MARPLSASGTQLARALSAALAGATFPAFVISVLLLGALLSTGMLLFPLERTPLAQFALEWKIWCFGYDPSDGSMIWAMVASFTTAPLLLAGLVALVFWQPLREALARGVGRLLAPAGSGALVLAGLSLGLYYANPSAAATDLPFPARALRTGYLAPAFELTDQRGLPVSIAQLRGRVVLVTAIYSRCGATCPMILADTRQALAALTARERAEVTVLAVTLDPQHDDVATLAAAAQARGLHAPHYHLLTGEPREVEAVLDRLSFARRRDPETGVIEHANLFTLIDRHGRIAYRFATGPRNRPWLHAALRHLVREP